jgi:hypothetical protein
MEKVIENTVSSKRYIVKLRQSTNKHVKAWRITDFIEKVNNSYYKKELLLEIEGRLKQGENPANIIIFDKSFNIHKNYLGLGTLKLNTSNGAKRLYHLGKPYSLYPNPRIILINNIFNTFSELYTSFNKHDVRLDKSILNKVIKNSLESEEQLDIRELYSELEDGFKGLGKDEFLVGSLKNKVDDELEKLRLIVRENLEKAKLFLEMENYIDDASAFKGKLKDDEYRKLFNLFPNKFAKYFINTIRPIVGIYNEKNNTIEILGVNFIKKNGYDDKQIDLKSVSHNSPFTVILIAGISLVTSLYQMHCNRYDRNIIDNEEEGTYSTLLELDLEEEEEDDDDDLFENEILEGRVAVERWQEIKEQLEAVIQKDNEVTGENFCNVEDTLASNEMNGNYSVETTIININNKVQIYFDKAFESNDFKDGEIEVVLEKVKDII